MVTPNGFGSLTPGSVGRQILKDQVGMATLPSGMPVEIEMIVEVEE